MWFSGAGTADQIKKKRAENNIWLWRDGEIEIEIERERRKEMKIKELRRNLK